MPDCDIRTLSSNHRLFTHKMIKDISKINSKYKVTFYDSDKSLIFENIYYVFKIYYIIHNKTPLYEANERFIDKWLQDDTSRVFRNFKYASVFQ